MSISWPHKLNMSTVKELRNPKFTPQNNCTENTVITHCPVQIPKATNVSSTEHVSTLGNLAPLAEESPQPISDNDGIFQDMPTCVSLEQPAPQAENVVGQYFGSTVSSMTLLSQAEVHRVQRPDAEQLARSCNTAISLRYPTILASPKISSTSSPEDPEKKKKLIPQNDDGNDHLITIVQVGQETAEQGTTKSALTRDEPTISDQDDDVQFILSVTRKRRKNRTQQGPLAPIVDTRYTTVNQVPNRSHSTHEFRLHSPPQNFNTLPSQYWPNFVENRMPSPVGCTRRATQEASTSIATIESLPSRSSFHLVPQWQASPQTSRIAVPPVLGNLHKIAYESQSYPYIHSFTGSSSPALPAVGITAQGLPAGSSQSTQGLTGPEMRILTSQPTQARQSYPSNMLVDIAQTCQDNFPFALIAKRHNQPIQKVFDTFSAVIQLPLLRSAVDARRPGKLGSQRMKVFRVMKKGMREMPEGKKAAKKMSHAHSSTGTEFK